MLSFLNNPSFYKHILKKGLYTRLGASTQTLLFISVNKPQLHSFFQLHYKIIYSLPTKISVKLIENN